MRICFVAEGCYPYAVGGVSSWIDGMIRAFPNVEFVLLTIVADRSVRGDFAYTLPENVTEVYEVYLSDLDWSRAGRGGHRRLTSFEHESLRALVLNRQCDWDTIFDLFRRPEISVDGLLMGEEFLHIVEELYDKRFPEIVFSDFLWTMRSIYLPLFLVLQAELPRADLYHCVATGYAGVLGCMAQHLYGSLYGSELLVSEHGIYTREREEELIKATWVQNTYKNIWINQFYRMSQVAYDRAWLVTSLYGHARELQLELGCPAEKTRITPNGIRAERFLNLPGKREEDAPFVNVGAVLRVTPIKDVKTMIQAFYRSNFILLGVPLVENLYGTEAAAVPLMLCAIIMPSLVRVSKPYLVAMTTIPNSRISWSIFIACHAAREKRSNSDTRIVLTDLSRFTYLTISCIMVPGVLALSCLPPKRFSTM